MNRVYPPAMNSWNCVAKLVSRLLMLLANCSSSMAACSTAVAAAAFSSRCLCRLYVVSPAKVCCQGQNSKTAWRMTRWPTCLKHKKYVSSATVVSDLLQLHFTQQHNSSSRCRCVLLPLSTGLNVHRIVVALTDVENNFKQAEPSSPGQHFSE